MISYLMNELRIPKEVILVEEHLAHYHVDSIRRADIIVHGLNEDVAYPVLVVECKAPEAYLDEKAHVQVFDYCDALGADYAMVCNGREMYCYKYSEAKQIYHELNEIVTFYHSGRIAVGNQGSGKLEELRRFVTERYPKIIEGKGFNLGALKNDHLWNIDQSDVIEVIVNFISYALIRDEYREYVKQHGK